MKHSQHAPLQQRMSYDDDDDGFLGYVESTVDPGPWINLTTALFYVVSIAVFPCLVAAGRKYEQRKLRAQVQQDLTVEENEVDDDLKEAPLETPNQESRSEVRSEAPKSYVHGRSAESGFSPPRSPTPPSRMTGIEIAGEKVQTFLDMLIMPPYPDDTGSHLSNTGSPGGGSINDVLDAGAVLRHRNAGVPLYRRCQKEQQWEEEHLMERRLDMQDAAARAMLTSLVKAAEKRDASSPPDEDDKSDNASVRWMQLKNVPEGTPLTPESLRRISASLPNEGFTCHFDDKSVVSSSVMESVCEADILPCDAIDGTDPGLIEKVPMEGENIDLVYGNRAWWWPSMMAAAFDRLLQVAEWDKEMKRILSLAIPFSLAAASKGGFELVRVALVANFVGTDAVGAYTIVLLILGLTQEFFGGFALTNASLCSHAVGVDNHFQAGKYVQISSVLYSLCMIPNVFVWMFFTDDVVRLFGFNELTCQMAQDYARFYVLTQYIQGWEEAYGSLLCVIEHELFYTVMRIGNQVVATCFILGLVLTKPTTLGQIGLVELGSQALFFALTLLITNWAGWMKDYTKGMFETNALRDKAAVRTVVKTAIPLALGQLLEFGEWEVLTIFVAFLGPAEVTTWGIVGSLWDTIEMLTEGFGDAGEIRTGFHLGAARPATARLSSYKTIIISIIFALIITSILWILGEDLATWLTPDPTLQRLILEVLPLLGVGNIALTAGSVSWALVGAQGRYRLATFVAFISSWSVTLPMAAIYTFLFRFDLQAMVSAVVIGYTITGTCLQYILVRSDWERLSKLVIEENEESDSSDESSSEEESSNN